MRQFWEIQHFDVTETLPGRVRLGWQGDFTIFAQNKHFNIGHEDGAAIHGFGKEDFDNAFYIYSLQEVIEESCTETGERFYLSSSPDDEPSQNFDEYQAVDEKWIEDQSENPPLIINRSLTPCPNYWGHLYIWSSATLATQKYPDWDICFHYHLPV